ncbi:MAG: hypothetical protein V1895_00730 [Parcubacteria group bacterium]
MNNDKTERDVAERNRKQFRGHLEMFIRANHLGTAEAAVLRSVIDEPRPEGLEALKKISRMEQLRIRHEWLPKYHESFKEAFKTGITRVEKWNSRIDVGKLLR